MRDRSKEIAMLEDTLKILKQGWYEKNGKRIQLKLSEKEMQEIQVYLPDDVKKNCSDSDFSSPFVVGRCGHGCENIDSFALARKRLGDTYLFTRDDHGILVLNLANPVHPGGGVRNGARAQEEDLCRKSSLLLSLESKEARKYYDYNKSLNTYMGSDALMVAPYVEIIKDENGDLLDDTVVVSVLTCAAPMISHGKEGMSESEYEAMVYNRIMGMLKCSAYLGYRHLVLGAWGCGAFGNDAHVISDLFYKALKELNYNRLREKDLFRRIDFAVLDRTQDQYNFKEFYRNFAFDNFYRDEDQ
ncbi:MAG: TIGR02452 family protein [Coprococcus sp.]|uniref:TIGR02452 family protein n=1 Tax=Coprococcus catus TaxID=116085 RepID=UPI001D087A56|nr:TIGR02452 family protein [Coprococcus catus]MCB6492487.1 TIGR02452 family protein [Coprococcus catus]